jgi:hypothetical protein
LAGTGTAVTVQELSLFPESLHWHVAAFSAGILVVALLERVYRRLLSDDSIKQNRPRGSA